MRKVKLFIIDDHQLVLDGLSSMINNAQDIELIGSAMNAKDAIAFVESSIEIDVIIVDINLPDKDGIELCGELISIRKDVKVLALTTYNEAGFVKRFMKNGGSGYLLKNTSAAELMDAVQTVHRGGQYLPEDVKSTLISSSLGSESKSFIPKLTRREKEVLSLIVDELTTKEIAEKLFISVATVETHRLHLLSKLEARNTAGLVKIAIRKGLI